MVSREIPLRMHRSIHRRILRCHVRTTIFLETRGDTPQVTLPTAMIMEISCGYLLPRSCRLLLLLAQEALQRCPSPGTVIEISYGYPLPCPHRYRSRDVRRHSRGAPHHRDGHGDILRIPLATSLQSFTITGAVGVNVTLQLGDVFTMHP